ncbi:MAG: hypothetical protein LBU79_09430 [Planctomycetota bacterium]|jgi:hypothetical protein|nr:hypothetical protein [Planctomycetota bacterium]
MQAQTCGFRRRRLFPALALLFFCLPGVSLLAGEDISSAAGRGRLNLRLPAPGDRGTPGVIPKNLAELESFTGVGFICLERGNFLVASELDPSESEYLVDGVLDFCRRALISAYFDRLPDPQRTVNLFVFRNYQSYVSGLRNFLAMEPVSPYGHYGNSQKYLVINYDTGPGTMVHEMTHALMADDFPAAPIWLAEGLASLYEQCRAEGNLLIGEDNWRLPELLAASREGKLIPLSRLLTLAPAAFRSGRESLHYAEARYFCKFLEEMGALVLVYRNFRDRQAEDPSGVKFIRETLGKPLDTIDAAWRQWLTFQSWRE